MSWWLPSSNKFWYIQSALLVTFDHIRPRIYTCLAIRPPLPWRRISSLKPRKHAFAGLCTVLEDIKLTSYTNMSQFYWAKLEKMHYLWLGRPKCFVGPFLSKGQLNIWAKYSEPKKTDCKTRKSKKYGLSRMLNWRNWNKLWSWWTSVGPPLPSNDLWKDPPSCVDEPFADLLLRELCFVCED